MSDRGPFGLLVCYFFIIDKDAENITFKLMSKAVEPGILTNSMHLSVSSAVNVFQI